MSLNKVMLIGRAGKDAELRAVSNGNQTASFSIATSEKYKDKVTGELKEKTEWHNIVMWGNLAVVAGKYVKKGDQVYIEGPLRHRSYEKDGVTRYVSEIVANTLTLLGSKKQGDTSPVSSSSIEQPVTAGGMEGDDVPF